MKKDIKVPKKMVDKEFARLPKKEKKQLAALDRGVGNMRPAVFEDKRRSKASRRPNVDHMYRSGKLD